LAPINYSTPEGSQQLVEFFSHFDQMSPEAQGWDLTVKDATDTGGEGWFMESVNARKWKKTDPITCLVIVN